MSVSFFAKDTGARLKYNGRFLSSLTNHVREAEEHNRSRRDDAGLLTLKPGHAGLIMDHFSLGIVPAECRFESGKGSQ